MGWCVAVLLAAGTDPLFAYVVHADAVVVGTVTAVGPAPPLANYHPAHWRVATVRVEEAWRGQVRPGERRVVFYDRTSHPPVPPGWQLPLAPGRRGVLLLCWREDGPPSLLNPVPPPAPESPAGRQVRRVCDILADPLRGLTAPTPADRYFAAALLANWYAYWRPHGGGPHSTARVSVAQGEPSRDSPVPADISRLILRAVAEQTDWVTARPGLERPDELLGGAYPTLGLTSADGWTWPEPALDRSDRYRVDAVRQAVWSELAKWVGGQRADRWVEALGDPDRPLPPTPVPSDRRDDAVWVVAEWCGAADPAAAVAADRVGLARNACHRWLDGPGERFVLRTSAGAFRPPPAGGWGR